MAVTTSIPTSYKQELLEALHNFSSSGGDAFKLALFATAATMDSTTTAYSASNEVTGTGYTAGGVTLTNAGTSSGSGTGWADFDNATWSGATFTAGAGLIYNSTNGNRAVGVHSFGGDVSVSAGTFQVAFPTADASNAIQRVA